MLEALARLGYVSKAVIYAIVGVLAILTAVNRGGRITDTSGALRVVLTQPFGQVLLIVLAIGLFGYAAWRLLDAAADPERHGTKVGGLLKRGGAAIRGVVYGGLGVEAIRLLRGVGGSSRDDAEVWTAWVLAWPLGEVALAIIGGAIAAYGVSQLVKSVNGRHGARLDLSAIRSDLRVLVRRIGGFGVGVRGALLATLGVFLIRAALSRDPSEAVGSRESILRLGGLVEGRWFLALIAAGVLAYAVDQAVHARCRRIRPVL